MNNYNHKQRRELEKKLGLLKKFQNLSFEDQQEIRQRKIAAGKQIHLTNVQESENRNIQSEADKFAESVQSWMNSGLSYEEADAMARKNVEVREKRQEKLAKRRNRQLEKNGNQIESLPNV
jgi:SHS2 domain-containing protein